LLTVPLGVLELWLVELVEDERVLVEAANWLVELKLDEPVLLDPEIGVEELREEGPVEDERGEFGPVELSADRPDLGVRSEALDKEDGLGLPNPLPARKAVVFLLAERVPAFQRPGVEGPEDKSEEEEEEGICIRLRGVGSLLPREELIVSLACEREKLGGIADIGTGTAPEEDPILPGAGALGLSG